MERREVNRRSAGSRQGDDFRQLGDPSGVAPAAELGKSILTQQEDERCLGMFASEQFEGIDGIGRSGAIDVDPRNRERWIVGDGQLDHGEAVGWACVWGLATVPWSARWHEQHPIELLDLARRLGHDQMAEMDGIERPAKHPEPHVGSVRKTRRRRTPLLRCSNWAGRRPVVRFLQQVRHPECCSSQVRLIDWPLRRNGDAGMNRRREQVGWYFYDWANSAFPTTVTTVFLGPYLTSVTRAAADAGGFVYPLGIPVFAGSFFPYLASVSVLSQVVVLPVLGAIADYSRRKKMLLGVFAYLGALATAGLYFVQGTNYLLGGALFLMANLAFGASIVFYNAFLPEIATPDERDRVSSQGWAFGYLGGGSLLALNLLLFSQAGALGLSQGDAARISLGSAGVWWAIFTIIPLISLRQRQPVRHMPPHQNPVVVGLKQLRETASKLPRYPQTVVFLIAYLLYNDGIQTVITLSSQFGQEELGIPLATLTSVILMVQFIAFFGALGMGWIAGRIGAKRTVMASLVLWTFVVVYAYGILRTTLEFWFMAVVIGLILGGSQALSRSMFSQMIPRGQEAEYYSIYEISERGTSWVGPLLFGLMLQFTGSYRQAILSLIIFFVLGLILLSRVDIRRAAREAGNEPPRIA